VFPASELPRLPESGAAIEGRFEIVRLRNDRIDYARTCEIWANTLRRRRAEATALVGAETTARWERYLKASSLGFWNAKLSLLRFKLRPL
jgi:cyclopropane-fatty-acyl-phospholipid synthase